MHITTGKRVILYFCILSGPIKFATTSYDCSEKPISVPYLLSAESAEYVHLLYMYLL